MPRRVKSTDSPELKQQRAPQPIKAGKKKPEAEVKAESESDDETMLSDTDMSVNSEPEDAQSKIDAALKEDHSYMMHIDEAGNLKKGMVAVLKDKHVCKILENHQSKTGKHGHAKCAIVGLEIFTGKKVQEAMPSSASVKVVDVEKTELRLVSIPTVDRHLEDVPGEPREALLRPLQEPAPSAAAIPPKPLAVTISDAAWEDLVDAYKESKHEKRGYDLTVTVTKAPKIKNDDDVTGVRRVTGFRKV